ncbi:MAG: tRNA U-34 5-methylaminomethyl-2-thiouridine biosynthesis protein [Gammaproteobacteria bacterium]|nr:tRNA U-34 5-methylaminomethyl-2-thiouridine biosynthesis protein [Gammaproteobacteria bacterium]MCP5200133.1 tRNA U-34 5-methylaminomethyl-2-thiouridine biosynthesis protein [Gammaproteobacteria bacterium]
MSIVCACLLPGSPLPYVRRDNPPWGALATAMEQAGEIVAACEPETLIVYSTQWFAVLDQLWLTRPRMQGLHVDENWHEYGELPFDFAIDLELAEAVIPATQAVEVRSKGVDYDGFPVDTGTIVANAFLNSADRYRLVVASNNLYHDWSTTHALGRIAAAEADRRARRVAVVGVGGLSGAFFRGAIDIAEDRIVRAEDDAWNRRVLDLIVAGDGGKLLEAVPAYAAEARVDMGFKHLAFILGALGDRYAGAEVHGYGPLYGAGGAVVTFRP